MSVVSRIKDLDIATVNPNSDDYIVLDGNAAGTRKMLVSNIKKQEIDNLTNLYNDITGKIKTVVTPEMFGAKGDGVTDDYDALLNAFNYKDNIIVLLTTGKIYGINKGIEIKKKM